MGVAGRGDEPRPFAVEYLGCCGNKAQRSRVTAHCLRRVFVLVFSRFVVPTCFGQSRAGIRGGREEEAIIRVMAAFFGSLMRVNLDAYSMRVATVAYPGTAIGMCHTHKCVRSWMRRPLLVHVFCKRLNYRGLHVCKL